MRTGRALALVLALGLPACGVLCSGAGVARAEGTAPTPPVAASAAPEVHTSWLAPPRPIWPLIAAVVVAGAGVAVSAVYALRGGTDQSNVDSASFEILSKTGTFGYANGAGACAMPTSADVVTACNSLKSSQDAVNTDNTLIIVGGVVTGTAVVAGLVYYFLGPGKGQAPSATQPTAVAPWLGGGASGFSLVGRF
jgi:hypothetical protein